MYRVKNIFLNQSGRGYDLIFATILFCIIFIMCFYNNPTEGISHPNIKDRDEFQKIEKEYKEYLANVPQTVRNEIIEYRKEIAQLNKKKIAIYNKLSQESQNFLVNEEEFKKKLLPSKKNILR